MVLTNTFRVRAIATAPALGAVSGGLLVAAEALGCGARLRGAERHGWNAAFSASGVSATVSNVDWNRSIPNNQNTGSEYLHATSAGQVRWNTGSTDTTTVWTFGRE